MSNLNKHQIDNPNTMIPQTEQNDTVNNKLLLLMERLERLEQESRAKDEKIHELEEKIDAAKKTITMDTIKARFLPLNLESKMESMATKIESMTADFDRKLELARNELKQDLKQATENTPTRRHFQIMQGNEVIESLFNLDDFLHKKINRLVGTCAKVEYQWVDSRVDKLQASMNEILEVKKHINELALLSDKTGIERVFRSEMNKVSSDVKEKATELIISTVERYLSDFGLTATDVKQISNFTHKTKDDLEAIATKIEGLDKKLTKKLKNYKARIETKIKEVNDRIPESEEYDPWENFSPEERAEIEEIESMLKVDGDGYPIYNYKCEDYFGTEVTGENCDEIFNALVVDYSDYVKRVGSAQQFNKKENIKPTGNIWTFAVERVGYPYSNELKEALISRYGLTHNRFCELSGLSKSRVSRYKKDLDKLSALIVEEAKEDYQDYFFHSEIEKFMPFEIICFW